MLINGRFVEIGEVSPVNAGIILNRKIVECIKPPMPGAEVMTDWRKIWPNAVWTEWTDVEQTLTLPYSQISGALGTRTYDIGGTPMCIGGNRTDVFEAVSVLGYDNTISHLGCGWNHANLCCDGHVYESKPKRIGPRSMTFNINVNGSWINWFSYNDGRNERKICCDQNSTMLYIKKECFSRGLKDPYLGSPICDIAGESWGSMSMPTQIQKFEWGMVHDSSWRRNYHGKTDELIQLLKDGLAYQIRQSNLIHGMTGGSVPTCCWTGRVPFMVEAIENGVWSPDNNWC